jgi:hypothetical protein
VTGRLRDMMRRPEVYWDAVLKTRAHLAERHSFKRRFKELLAILQDVETGSAERGARSSSR